MEGRRLLAAAALAAALAGAFGGRAIEALATYAGREPAGVVSFELADAPPAPTAAERVALWLQLHGGDFARAERRFGVDRRAIGAAIAYEALADPRSGGYLFAARFSGPGKVHYREHRFSEGDPSAKQVEDLGLMPHRDMFARRAALRNPAVAIAYVAAIMSAFVRYDAREPAALRCADAHLVTLYTAWKPDDFARGSLAVARDNAAGDWAGRHDAYLTAALGAPPSSFCEAATARWGDSG